MALLCLSHVSISTWKMLARKWMEVTIPRTDRQESH